MSSPPELTQLSETSFEHQATNATTLNCPSLDLSTRWDPSGRNLHIIRPPGEIVSRIHQVGAPAQKPPEVQTVAWKHDGQFLAVGWSDGLVRLMGLENNKAAHHIHVCGEKDSTIVRVAWNVNSLAQLGQKKVISRHTEEQLDKSRDGEREASRIDLPRELTFLEVDTALPKISPLPTSSAGSGEDAMVFTLRTGLEFLFQAPKPEDYDDVNVMIVGLSDGRLHLSIYDSFTIGLFSSPKTLGSTAQQLVHHASNPKISTHCLALASATSGSESMHLVPMDLPFISSAPINLSLLCSKLTTLQKLLRYLKQTQLHMQVEWKNARELPNRFLRSVEGDLEKAETGPRGIVPALFHTVVTGHAHGPLREWLVDTLAERVGYNPFATGLADTHQGHKRWDKAVHSALENLRCLVHENFLPVLERCSIILSRLKGLAQFYDARDDIGFSVVQIDRVMDIINCLSLVGHKILLLLMDELECFHAFSTWLRFIVDRLASSSTTEELTEKEATMDNVKVLTYIERFLTNSPLDIFFDEVAKDEYSSDWNRMEDGVSLLDILDKQLQKHDAGQPSMKALPHVDFLINYATSRSAKIFTGVAEAMKRSVRFGSAVELSIGQPIARMDLKMSAEGQSGASIHAAVLSEGDANTVYLYRFDVDVTNGISSSRQLRSCSLKLENRTLIDARYVNPQKLILLCKHQEVDIYTTMIIHTDSPQLPFRSSEERSLSNVLSVNAGVFPENSVPAKGGFKPIRMEAYDRSDVRGEIPPRICLLGSNRTTSKTFILP